MSFKDNYLKLRQQRTNKPNAENPAQPNVETLKPSAAGADTFSNKYLELRQKRINDSLPNATQVHSSSPADSLDKKSEQPVRKTTSGGYYERPDFGSRSEELYNNVASLEPAYKEARTALETAQAGVQETEANLKFWQEHVSLLKDAYIAAPSKINADLYNKACTSFSKLYETYSRAHSAYSAAYEMYKPLEDQINQAIKEYQTYSDSQQTQFKQWRDTIRDPETIKKELDSVNAQLTELYKGDTLSGINAFLGNLAANMAASTSGLAPTNMQFGTDSSAEIQKLKEMKKLLEEEYDWSQYYQYAELMKKEDFAQKSQYASTANGLKAELHPLSGLYTETGFDDLTYDYINRNKDAYGKALVNSIADNTALLGLDTSYLKQMSDDEIAIFNYLYATQGVDAAYQYTAYLTADLNARQRRENEAYWAKYAEEHPVKASAFSVLMSPMKGLSYIGQAADYAADGKIDQNAAYNKFSYTNSTIRNQVTKEIQKNQHWGEIGSFAYQTGMSMADFLMATALTGNNQAITLAVMGSGAAADTTIAAKDRGLSDHQAFTLGTVAGLAEAVIESFNMETVFNPKLFKDGLWKYVLKNATSEGLEEVATDVVNLFTDILVAKDQSQWQQSIDAYIKEGKSQAEAVGLALADQAAQMGADFLGGAISGGILSGITGGAHVKDTRNLGKELGGLNMNAEDLQAFIETGLESDPSTEAYHVANKLQAKINAGEKLSDYDLGMLYRANVQAVAAEQASTDTDEDAPEGLSLPTLENNTDPAVDTVTPGDITQNTDTQNPAFGTQNTAFGTQNTAFGTQNTAFGTQNAAFGTQNTTFDTQNTAFDAQLHTTDMGAPISVAQRLRQEQNLNGGIQNVNINERAGQPAAAYPAARGIAQSGTNLPDGIQQRNVGSRAGEQDGSLAGRTIRDAATVDWRRATVDRQNRIGHLRLEKVSSIDLGLQSGTETKNVQVVPQEHWDADMTELADRIRKETGKNLTFVMGQIQVRSGERDVSCVNGVFTGNGIIVRADNIRMPMVKIADHEAYHAKNQETDRLLNREIRRHIVETFTEEQFRTVMEKYVIALRGVYSVEDARTGDEYESLMRHIEEEVFADAYAGINAFGAGADQFTEAVNQKMDELRVGKLRMQDNGVRETTGPPIETNGQKENTAGIGSERYLVDTENNAADTYLESANMTADELREGEEIAAFIHEVNSMIDSAKRSKRKRKIGTITKRHAELINKLMRQIKPDFNVVGYELWIDGTGASHIEARHGEYGKADRSMATREAKMLIPWASQNADACGFIVDDKGNIKHSSRFFNSDGTRPPEISMEKKLDNDTVCVSECVPDSESKRIWITSAYIKKGSTGQKLNMEETSPQPTPEAIFDSSATNNIVATQKQSVKTEADEDIQDMYGLKLPTLDDDTIRTDRYSYAGEHAETADLDALERAKEMQAAGVADETIRQQTGWHVGMDGKWRWEIDDSKMAVSHEMIRGTQWEDLYRHREAQLTDIVQHDALFEAYPQLRSVRVKLEPMMMSEGGYYVPETNEIILNSQTIEDPKKVLIHEIQHIIQNLERFSPGASKKYWQEQKPAGEKRSSWDLYRNTAGEIEARDAAKRRNMDADARRLTEPASANESTVFADDQLLQVNYDLNADEEPQGLQLPTLDEEHEAVTRENEASPFKTGTRKGNPSGNTPSAFSLPDESPYVKNQFSTIEKFSVDEDSALQGSQKKAKPVVESKPIIAKREFRNTLLGFFSIPDGQRAELGSMIDGYADRLIKNGQLTEADRKIFFDKMYNSGVMVMPADEIYSYGRDYLKNGRIYVSDSLRAEFGDDWNEFRKRAFGAGVYLTSNRNDAGTDVWNAEMSDLLPGLFDSEETDQRSILERIIHVAEEGKGERMSLPEYTAQLAGIENQSEADFLDAMERQMDYLLRAFAEKASLEIYLRDRTGVKIAQEREKGSQRLTRERVREAQRRADERERRQDMARRQRERKELQELQKKTMKQLQWLSKNRNRAPEELKAEWDEVLGDLDLYAIGAANEMNWSDKHNATWKDIVDMYDKAKSEDPNFFEYAELDRIVTRLRGDKLADLDIDALNDLYKLAVGLRTAYYNRNNVINDEMNRLFAEAFTDSVQEMRKAPGGNTWDKENMRYVVNMKNENVADKFMNLQQLTPMNVLQRMGGWDPNSVLYSFGKQLERGERDKRAYYVKAQEKLEGFTNEHESWVKRADGQGKDAIWYELEVPQLQELRMGDKPIFGPTVKVYMTPAQKVHMYLESKNQDNLRHMTGGRTFVNKELYRQGERKQAFINGTTIKLAPETVKQLVSDLTAEELELAQILEQYYNTFAKLEINRTANVLYGYDKAMGSYYAPIYTDQNYTKKDIGVYEVTAESQGSLKSRNKGSTAPTYNISAFEAFEKNVEDAALFCGMAIPLRNMKMLLEWGNANGKFKGEISRKWGEKTEKYVENLIRSLQGEETYESDMISSFAAKLQSKYISAVFGANPSIVLKQLGSIPLAGAYLDARNLPKPAQVLQIDRELISKYSKELEWRTMGYSTPEIKHLKDNPNWTQTNKTVKFIFGGGAITAMDGWAASVLWPWAENKVRREHPELAVGTEAEINNGESAFYKKVAEEFENALSRSQSVSDEIHQGSLRKSKDVRAKALTLFRSDSAQTYNALRQKIGEARYYARTGAKENVLRSAKKAAGSVFVAMILNAAWAEAINFLMAMWKNKGKNYRDDEDELTFGSVAGEMVAGMLGSFSGVVTGGEEVFEVIGNIITGDTWYGIDTPGMEQLNDMVDVLVESGTGLRDLVAGAADILSNGGDLGEYFSKHSGDMLGSIKDLAQAAAVYLPGFPAENIEAYLLGALKWISPELGTAYEDMFSDMGKGDLSGLEGGELETRISGILSKRRVSESDETAQALAELYAAEYKEAIPSDTPSSIEINEEKQTLGAYQQQVYDTVWSDIVSGVLDDLVASSSFQSAEPKARAKMLKSLYSYAAEKAKEELFDEYEIKSSAAKIDRLKTRGITLKDYVILQGMIPAYDANNNESYSNSEVQAAIDSVLPGLSTEKKAALWQEVTGTTSAKNNPYSQKVGQSVLDGKSNTKTSAAAQHEEEDLTFEEAILRQWAGS